MEGTSIHYHWEEAETSSNKQISKTRAVYKRFRKSLFVLFFISLIFGFSVVPCITAQFTGVIVASGDLEGYSESLRGMVDVYQLNDSDSEADYYLVNVMVSSIGDQPLIWRLFDGFCFEIECNQGGMIDRWDAQLFTMKMGNFNFLRWTIVNHEGILTNEFQLIALGYQTTWCDIFVEIIVPNDDGLDLSVTVTIQWPKYDKEIPTVYEAGSWSVYVADISPG